MLFFSRFKPIRLLVLLAAVLGLLGLWSLYMRDSGIEANEPAASSSSWQEITAAARGQVVFFNAWGGQQSINDYIAWVGGRVLEEYGVEVRHVKLSNTADAVRSVMAEKAAGISDDGRVDLIWINGENFRSMKENGLLFGPFAESLPNFSLVDTEGKPTTRVDFTVPTEGYESPWGMAQLIFIYNTATVAEEVLPMRMRDFLDFAKARPGRVTYPAPPDFIGVTFLKQALYEFVDNAPAVLARPPGEDFESQTAALWAFLDALHPFLWQRGRNFPANWPAQNRLLNDGEIDLSISFNPGDASSGILNKTLPATVRSFVLKTGSIGNTHFVAIPFNARAKEGAQVVANFLLSPEAQLRKEDPNIWGDPTVLNMDALSDDARAAFLTLERGVATLTPAELGRVLPEPHPEWSDRLKQVWRERYAR